MKADFTGPMVRLIPENGLENYALSQWWKGYNSPPESGQPESLRVELMAEEKTPMSNVSPEAKSNIRFLDPSETTSQRLAKVMFDSAPNHQLTMAELIGVFSRAVASHLEEKTR